MRIVFMGSAELACASLDRLLGRPDDAVVAVVTQPDRPQGRALRTAPCQVRRHVGARDIPVLTPEKVNRPESLAALADLRPDLLVVVAYGQILRRALLDLPPLGCINVHASLLPAWRGAAPIQWSIAAGDTETGVTTMRMNEGMDEGDILLQTRLTIGPDETAGALHDRLAAAGAELLDRTIDRLAAGTLTATPQDATRATHARKLTKADGRIDWTLSAQALHNRIRGFNPTPGCFCEAPAGSGASLRVLRSGVEDAAASPAEPGHVLECSPRGPLVATGAGALRLCEVQPAGGRAMEAAAWLCGHALRPGDRMG